MVFFRAHTHPWAWDAGFLASAACFLAIFVRLVAGKAADSIRRGASELDDFDAPRSAGYSERGDRDRVDHPRR